MDFFEPDQEEAPPGPEEEGQWGPWEHQPDHEARHRCTSAEKAVRVREALELLLLGYGSALTAKTLADRYGVTPRQARNYVGPAARMLYVPLTRSELMTMAQENLHTLQTVSGQAMITGDLATVIKSNAAIAAATARYLRTFTTRDSDSEPVGRYRLRTSRTRPETIG